VSGKANKSSILFGINILHTAVWMIFAARIVAIPFAVTTSRFSAAAVLSGRGFYRLPGFGGKSRSLPIDGFSGSPHG
jgi:hypothetical protein